MVWWSQTNARGATQEWWSSRVQAQVDEKAHCFKGRHQVPPTTYAGRHSPSVCARCAWTPGAGLSQLLQESTRQPLGLTAESEAVFQELCKETIGNCWEAGITPCCCAAIAVLWLALAPERFPSWHFQPRCRYCWKTKVVPDPTKQCKGFWANLCHYHWNKISWVGSGQQWYHSVR